MINKGWVSVHRKLLDKPIWIESTPEQKVVLITLLLMANHAEREWEWKGERYTVKEGQFISSLAKIAGKCGSGVSIQNVRTALKRFEKYGFLTDESTNKNRLITIVNWRTYQGSERDVNIEFNRQLTGNQQATNRQLTPNNNVNNENNVNNDIVEQARDLPHKKEISEIVDYLNLTIGSNYQSSTKKTKTKIRARLAEGFTVTDFKKVIDNKSSEWLDDANMSKYLRPETLFGSKFESYLNQPLKKFASKSFERDASEYDLF